MKRFALVVLVVSMVVCCFGCGKKSGLEGKIVDEKGAPVANVKIIAKQIQPIKGYEQFETTTGSDGKFSFGKLFPTSEYILFPWYEDWTEAPMRTLKYETSKLVARFNKEGWTTEQKMKVQSGPEGQTTMLTSPMVIQSCISTVEGKVIDGKKKPLKSIKIIAKQVKPVPGYEQFEATTGSDGTFRFGKLFPTSEYILFLSYKDWTEAPMRTLRYEANKLTARFNKEGWTTERKMKAQSGAEGQTIILASPMVIQPCISTVTGKLVDGRKRPLKGIKIIAKQVKPVPGYEQFEATTGADGSFSFTKLYPDSKYRLIPRWNFKTDGTWTVMTKGVQKVRQTSPSFRFILTNGVVSAFRTGLQWAERDNGRDISWPDAKAYCTNYKSGGFSDWRLPTRTELQSLYSAGIRCKSENIINISACNFWVEAIGSSVHVCSLSGGWCGWTYPLKSKGNRALPVRGGK